MSPLAMRTENADFLQHAYKTVWMAAGAQEADAEAVSRGISLGDRMGKLTQGIGVFEVLFVALENGNMNFKASPEIVAEGPTWALYEGHQTTGFWILTEATKKAIEKARQHAIGIGMARNLNDTGSFFTYTSLALEQGMFAMSTNNGMPWASPWGGMENKLSGAPFCASLPGGEEYPLVTDIQFVEVHDGNISEAVLNNQKLKRKYLVDPDTGELTDDPSPYFVRLPGFGRVSDCIAPSVFDTPRMYALNIFTEMLCTLMVPGATITPEMPHPISVWLKENHGMGMTGGGFVLVIDPSHFGSMDELKAKSDRFVRAVKSAKKRPGVEEIFLPGERGFRRGAESADVEILESHWQPFVERAEKYGVNIEELRKQWQMR